MPSTVIRALAYDPPTRTLFVTFVDGDIYAYLDVPESLYKAFRTAPSRGRFFAYKVRNRFDYRRLDEPPEDTGAEPGPRGGPGQPGATVH